MLVQHDFSLNAHTIFPLLDHKWHNNMTVLLACQKISRQLVHSIPWLTGIAGPHNIYLSTFRSSHSCACDSLNSMYRLGVSFRCAVKVQTEFRGIAFTEKGCSPRSIDNTHCSVNQLKVSTCGRNTICVWLLSTPFGCKLGHSVITYMTMVAHGSWNKLLVEEHTNVMQLDLNCFITSVNKWGHCSKSHGVTAYCLCKK